MKEKILALLLAKFAGVRKDALAQMARTLVLSVTTEEDAKTFVEKLTSDQVDEFAKDFRKDVDKEVSDANKTHESNLKKKYDLVEKKDPSDPGKDPKDPKTDPNDIAAIVAAALDKVVKPLQEKLAGFEGQKITEARLQSLEGKLKDLPDTFKSQKLKDFRRMNFESEETFTEYLAEVETDITGLKQELADKGLSGQPRPLMGGQDKNGVSQGVASFIASKAEEGKALTGKEI